jgi:hypothetical protein
VHHSKKEEGIETEEKRFGYIDEKKERGRESWIDRSLSKSQRIQLLT